MNRDRMARNDTNLTGAAGEHLVVATLCRLGWAAGFAPQGYKGTNTLAVNEESQSALQVQVRTARHRGTAWNAAGDQDPVGPPDTAWWGHVEPAPHPADQTE